MSDTNITSRVRITATDESGPVIDAFAQRIKDVSAAAQGAMAQGMTGETKKLGYGLEQVRKTADAQIGEGLSGAFNKASGAMAAFTKGLTGISVPLGLAGVALAVGEIMSLGLTKFASFEEAMTRINILTKANTEEQKKYKAAVEDAAEAGHTTSQQAGTDFFNLLANSKLTKQEATDNLKLIEKEIYTSGANHDQTINAIASMSAAYNVKGTDLKPILDMMNTNMKAGVQDEYSSLLRRITPELRQTGQNTPENLRSITETFAEQTRMRGGGGLAAKAVATGYGELIHQVFGGTDFSFMASGAVDATKARGGGMQDQIAAAADVANQAGYLGRDRASIRRAGEEGLSAPVVDSLRMSIEARAKNNEKITEEKDAQSGVNEEMKRYDDITSGAFSRAGARIEKAGHSMGEVLSPALGLESPDQSSLLSVIGGALHPFFASPWMKLFAKKPEPETSPQGGAPPPKKFARGGDVKAGVPIIVGDDGEELFVPQENGSIVPGSRASRGGTGVQGGDDTRTIQENTDAIKVDDQALRVNTDAIKVLTERLTFGTDKNGNRGVMRAAAFTAGAGEVPTPAEAGVPIRGGGPAGGDQGANAGMPPLAPGATAEQIEQRERYKQATAMARTGRVGNVPPMGEQARVGARAGEPIGTADLPSSKGVPGTRGASRPYDQAVPGGLGRENSSVYSPAGTPVDKSNAQRVTLRNGVTFDTNAANAPQVKGMLDELIAQGAPITEAASYGERRGNASAHPTGMATDVNQANRGGLNNPALGKWIKENQDKVNAAEIRWNQVGGEHWKSPDTGHWTFGGQMSQEQMAAAQASSNKAIAEGGGRPASSATASLTPPTSDTPETRMPSAAHGAIRGPTGDAGGERSDYLKNERSRYAAEFEKNPELRLRAAAITSLENEGAGTGVMESLMNRKNIPGSKGTIESGMRSGPKSFYAGARDGRVERRMEELRRNPKRFEQINARTNEALEGSNRIRGYTDQGSKGDPNYEEGGVGININRERFNDWGVRGSKAYRLHQQAEVEAERAGHATASNGAPSTTDEAAIPAGARAQQYHAADAGTDAAGGYDVPGVGWVPVENKGSGASFDERFGKWSNNPTEKVPMPRARPSQHDRDKPFEPTNAEQQAINSGISYPGAAPHRQPHRRRQRTPSRPPGIEVNANPNSGRPFEDDPNKASYAPIKSYAEGTEYVPRDMLAQIHEGERITPAGEHGEQVAGTPNAGTAGRHPIHAELDALEKRHQQMRSEMEKPINVRIESPGAPVHYDTDWRRRTFGRQQQNYQTEFMAQQQRLTRGPSKLDIGLG